MIQVSFDGLPKIIYLIEELIFVGLMKLSLMIFHEFIVGIRNCRFMALSCVIFIEFGYFELSAMKLLPRESLCVFRLSIAIVCRIICYFILEASYIFIISPSDLY